MNNTAPTTPRSWRIYIHGRESAPGRPFARITETVDGQDALDQIKTELDGSPAAYDRDALAPALVAVPDDCPVATAAPAARARRNG